MGNVRNKEKMLFFYSIFGINLIMKNGTLGYRREKLDNEII